MKKLIAEKVKINVGREKVEYVDINIYVNEKGNLILENIGSIIYEMLNDELTLIRIKGE